MLRQRQRTKAMRTANVHRTTDAARQLAEAGTGVPDGNDPATMTVWWQLVEGRDNGLAAATASIGATDVDDPLTPALAAMAAARQGLRDAIAQDRALRIGPPSPTDDQLAYSAAAIRERSGALRATRRRP